MSRFNAGSRLFTWVIEIALWSIAQDILISSYNSCKGIGLSKKYTKMVEGFALQNALWNCYLLLHGGWSNRELFLSYQQFCGCLGQSFHFFVQHSGHVPYQGPMMHLAHFVIQLLQQCPHSEASLFNCNCTIFSTEKKIFAVGTSLLYQGWIMPLLYRPTVVVLPLKVMIYD